MISRIGVRTAVAAGAAAILLLSGCATPQPYDYSALRQAKPQSILVLPPLNQTPEVTAPAGVLSRATLPLAESGYYVLPVAVTEETFRNNGIISAQDAQELPVAKLREIFGADAALYLDVRQYGSVYSIVSSETPGNAGRPTHGSAHGRATVVRGGNSLECRKQEFKRRLGGHAGVCAH